MFLLQIRYTNIFLSCSEVSNEFISNEAIIYNVSSTNYTSNQIIQEKPYFLIWHRLNGGYHNNLHFSLLDSSGNSIKLLTTDITITLVISDISD